MKIPEELSVDGGIYFLPKDGESQEDCRRRVREEYFRIYGKYPDHSKDSEDYLKEILSWQD